MGQTGNAVGEVDDGDDCDKRSVRRTDQCQGQTQVMIAASHCRRQDVVELYSSERR